MARRPPMRTVAFANSKGGVGKTTLCVALAVRAAQEPHSKVALIDLDPQASLAAWWGRRAHDGSEQNPKLFEMDAAIEAIELLKSEGWSWCFIDTPPGELPRIEAGIAACDAVLIPVGPSALDVEQVNVVAELCETHGVPFAFVLNRAAASWKLTQTTAAYLASGSWRSPRGGNYVVLDPLVPTRSAYMAGMTVGRSGPEVDKEGAARDEIDALWESVKDFVAVAMKKARAA